MSGLLYKMCWNFAIPGPCICSSFYSIIKPTYFIKWILFIWSGLAWHCTSSELHYSMAWPGMASSDRPTKTRTHQLSDTTTHTHNLKWGPSCCAKTCHIFHFQPPSPCLWLLPHFTATLPLWTVCPRRLQRFHLILIISSFSLFLFY